MAVRPVEPDEHEDCNREIQRQRRLCATLQIRATKMSACLADLEAKLATTAEDRDNFEKLGYGIATKARAAESERDRLAELIGRCHEALGEGRESDDETLPNGIAAQVEGLRKLNTRCDRLAEALAEYGEHRSDCAIHQRTPEQIFAFVYPPCSCGLSGAIAACGTKGEIRADES